MNLPQHFTRNITDVFGDTGAAWLDALPGLLRACEERWSIDLKPPFDLNYNYVAPAVRIDGTLVVLKAGVPAKELLCEIAALRHCDGRGIVQLLDADAERGVMLLERIAPGTPLFDLDDDDAATEIAADVMREMWRPLPAAHAFPTVAEWASGLSRLRARFDGGTGPLPGRLVEIAESRFAELLASSDAPVLLHGDLHHWNILRAERRPWLALDPKGVAGEPAYEAAALLRNPVPLPERVPDLRRTLSRRLDLLSERLAMDRARLLGWGMAQAVLSAWWSVEDHGSGWEAAIAVAEALQSLDAASSLLTQRG